MLAGAWHTALSCRCEDPLQRDLPGGRQAGPAWNAAAFGEQMLGDGRLPPTCESAGWGCSGGPWVIFRRQWDPRAPAELLWPVLVHCDWVGAHEAGERPGSGTALGWRRKRWAVSASVGQRASGAGQLAWVEPGGCGDVLVGGSGGPVFRGSGREGALPCHKALQMVSTTCPVVPQRLTPHHGARSRCGDVGLRVWVSASGLCPTAAPWGILEQWWAWTPRPAVLAVNPGLALPAG